MQTPQDLGPAGWLLITFFSVWFEESLANKYYFPKGTWTSDAKKPVKTKERTAARKMKTEEGLTENIGLPLNLLEKHEPWPAYVTYTSPIVKRLIEKSKMRELECTRTFEESRRKQNKPSGVIQLKRRKSSKSSGDVYRDMSSEPTLSLWGAYSVLAMSPAMTPEPTRVHTDSRECPTANYNKIIFSRKPIVRTLPYSSLLASKEKHSQALCQGPAVDTEAQSGSRFGSGDVRPAHYRIAVAMHIL
ncbi:CMT1A duplicated region transcript 4 protein [Eulemur rufifrons]|uniref:CMT1A duplicated region transcript 4 protein n=1 Tax=Eulemur rufifrons TaxID=859984 RepID=UPI00374229F8